MKKFIFLFFLCLASTWVEATIINFKSLCEGKKTETCQVFYEDKGSKSIRETVSSYFSNSTDNKECKGIILDKKGHILAPKLSSQQYKNLIVNWSDQKGNIYSAIAHLVAEHPKLSAALLKINNLKEGNFKEPPRISERIKKDQWLLVVNHRVQQLECYFQIAQLVDITRIPGEGFYGRISLTYSPELVGAPVYNTHGNMIGLISGFYPDSNQPKLLPFSDINDWINEKLRQAK